MLISSYKDFLTYLNTLESKKTLLLHSCCAPCSSQTISLLQKYFDLTIMYSNDNIYPKEEYVKRLDEQKKFISEFNNQVKIIYDDYNDVDYYEAIKGNEHLGEKTVRCYKCYQLRMEKTALKAKELGFDFFSTTLSISPHKNSEWINEIGYNLEEKYNIKFLYSNFKKEEGYKKSIELAKSYDLYRQEYCGCIYSFNEFKKR